MHKHTMTFLAAALLLAWGCGETNTTAEGGEIADALEQDNGGLTMEDEAPAFGDPEAFRDVPEYEPVEDELADDPVVDDMRERMKDWTLGNQMQGVIDDSRLADHYAKEPQERMETRMENLRELVNAADAFVIPQDDADAGLTELQSFLSHAALEAGDTQAENWEDCVQMMTLHSAKGLEFHTVFVIGCEEQLFPHWRSMDRAEDLEEERRLMYVAMTTPSSVAIPNRARNPTHTATLRLNVRT